VRLIILLGLLLILLGCSGQSQTEQANRERYERFAAQQLAQYRATRAMGRDDLALNFAEDLLTRYPGSAAAKEVAAEVDALRAKAETERDKQRLERLWTYHAVPHESGEDTVYTAFLYSQGAAGASPANEDEPRLRMVVRRHPEWGESVYLLSDAGNYACTEPCPMRIAFDAGEWMDVPGTPADSGSAPALFIERDFSGLLGDLRTSKRFRVEIPLEGGATEFVFEIGQLDADRLYPPKSG
jgi:hypothetical protein